MYSDLSKCFSPQDTLSESADNCRKNGCWRVNGNVQSVNKVNDGILLVFVADNDCNVVYQQLFNNVGSAIYIRRYWFGTWSGWVDIALKSNLSDIIIEKGFQKSVNIPAGNAYATIECDIEYTVPSGYRALAIYKGLVTNSTCCVYNAYFTGGKARLVISNLNGSQKTVTAYAFIFFIKS